MVATSLHDRVTAETLMHGQQASQNACTIHCDAFMTDCPSWHPLWVHAIASKQYNLTCLLVDLFNSIVSVSFSMIWDINGFILVVYNIESTCCKSVKVLESHQKLVHAT